MDEKKRIFIGEDHAILLYGLRAMLGSHPDYEIIGEAEDGREAVRGVENSKPGLVILDLSRLRMNGVGTLKKIKKCLPESTVLVLNARLHKNVSLLNGTALRPGQPFPCLLQT